MGDDAATPPELEAYLDMSADDVARLVLCLLIEEALRLRLAGFRRGRLASGEVLDDGTPRPVASVDFDCARFEPMLSPSHGN